MKENFYLNPEIDMTKIVDSMQLDSYTEIAVLQKDGYEASLEVRGEVKVWWNENGNPMDGEYYIYPSEFPDDLKKLIASEKDWTSDPRIYISENNWFEIFVINSDNEFVPDACVVDAEGMTKDDIYSILNEYIEYAKESRA